MAEGPMSWPSNASIPDSRAAMAVSVFFTTAYSAFSPRERRSVFS